MLHEIKRLRQSNRVLKKRWFTSTDMDLFIWFRHSVPVRFQLAFDKHNQEKMISWDIHHGCLHYAIDNGEERYARYKQTPILVNIDKLHDMAVITRNFLSASEELDVSISDFIFAKLMECPGFYRRTDAAHINRPLT